MGSFLKHYKWAFDIPPTLLKNGMYIISIRCQSDYRGVLLHLSNPFNLKTRTPGLLSSR